jgi:hypothetical protein
MKKIKEIINYDSSIIESSNYEYETQTLIITFKGGSMYQYNGVSVDDYVKFSTSDSVGSEFNKTVSKNYSYEKIETV